MIHKCFFSPERNVYFAVLAVGKFLVIIKIVLLHLSFLWDSNYMYIDHLILSLSSSSLDEHMEGNNIDNNHDVREKKLEVREKRGKLLIEN